MTDERKQQLYDLWENEVTAEDEEWRDDLTPEEAAMVEAWDNQYDTDTARVGQDKLDDLIRWAECYADNPEVMAIVVEDDLPEDLSDECWEFVSENEVPPGGFVDATTAAVAVMTGALKDPFNETI